MSETYFLHVTYYNLFDDTFDRIVYLVETDNIYELVGFFVLAINRIVWDISFEPFSDQQYSQYIACGVVVYEFPQSLKHN